MARRLLRHGWEMARYGRATTLLNGVALIARLFELADRHGARWMVSSPAGRVTGAALQTPHAAKSSMRCSGHRHFGQSGPARAIFPHAQNHETLAVPEADGAGLALARPLGPILSMIWPPMARGVRSAM
jgi:hypothetical protein